MVLRVGRQRCLWCALVEQSPLKNRVHVGGVRRLHRSAERHRRGRSAEPPLRGVMAMFEGHNHRTVTRVVQGLAALAACHRVRVASPEVIQRLGWRNLGGAWIHTLRRGGSQGFAGQATRGTTISARCHGCVVRGMCIVSANAWDTPRYSRTAAPGRVGRDYMNMNMCMLY